MLNFRSFFFHKVSKRLSTVVISSAGRNFFGSICVQHQGARNKNNFMKMDRYSSLNSYGFVFHMLRHFFFTGYIGLMVYNNGLIGFILLSEGVSKGNKVFSGSKESSLYSMGSTQTILNMSLFDFINSMEYFPKAGFKLVSAAGCFSIMFSKEMPKSLLKLSSGWQLRMSNFSLATLGMVSHPSYIYNTMGKAGANSIKGISPTVSGVMKNPCDHPHGGGEGSGSPPSAHVSPWGWLCKGTPTKKKKTDSLKSRFFSILK